MEEGTSKSPSRCADTGDAYVDARQWDTREDCEVRQILDRVADKWSLLVIALLDRRSLRFTELSREIDGVSQRMLTVTLRHLERDGLVRRTVHPVVPPRVDYELTPLGVTLHDTIQSLVTWTERHQNEIAAARADYDTRAETAPVTPAVTAMPTASAASAVPTRPVTPAAPVTRAPSPPRNETRVTPPPRNETLIPSSPRNETRAMSSSRDEPRAASLLRDEGTGGAGTSRCEMCGAPIHGARTGRPARFCGTACRQRAHRHRSRATSRPSG
ncbi:winged helix-turn-helix transcriptional regulator [Streptosporangium sp. NPDC050855]|uniref:winged helix-turn-helix transcriptional regulator n=1 Tax=Streptosporangium sp. NPDC050855 TaxID=3366194 RepID=UPI00378A6220